jgi:hypothetical protein
LPKCVSHPFNVSSPTFSRRNRATPIWNRLCTSSTLRESKQNCVPGIQNIASNRLAGSGHTHDLYLHYHLISRHSAYIYLSSFISHFIAPVLVLVGPPYCYVPIHNDRRTLKFVWLAHVCLKYRLTCNLSIRQYQLPCLNILTYFMNISILYLQENRFNVVLYKCISNALCHLLDQAHRIRGPTCFSSVTSNMALWPVKQSKRK